MVPSIALEKIPNDPTGDRSRDPPTSALTTTLPQALHWALLRVKHLNFATDENFLRVTFLMEFQGSLPHSQESATVDLIPNIIGVRVMSFRGSLVMLLFYVTAKNIQDTLHLHIFRCLMSPMHDIHNIRHSLFNLGRVNFLRKSKFNYNKKTGRSQRRSSFGRENH
jgi:hypothetical protein